MERPKEEVALYLGSGAEMNHQNIAGNPTMSNAEVARGCHICKVKTATEGCKGGFDL